MNKLIAIIAGEPNSISSEIIFKSWSNRQSYKHRHFIIIGSFELLNSQRKKLNFKIKIKKINDTFSLKNLKRNELSILDVDFIQKKPFEKISVKSRSYILKCFDKAIKLTKNKKILGFINCPVSKEFLFTKDYQGVTEYLSKKAGKNGNEVMLIYNKKLSVCPVTTHIPLSQVTSEISINKIVKKVKTINNFYRTVIKIKPNFGILGLNPHNFSIKKNSIEINIIQKAIKKLKENKINVVGPLPADSSFAIYDKYKFNVIVGMYHDQVLAPFKALFKFDAINITLGLPYVRISPDHGVAENIVAKKIAKPDSLVEAIKFFNYIK